jgi:hypothetical protein
VVAHALETFASREHHRIQFKNTDDQGRERRGKSASAPIAG